jgi:hypothetical protein
MDFQLASDDPDRNLVIAQLGPSWASMCCAHSSTTFLWAHNGKQRNGWVQLLPNGKLSTTWCLGTWSVLANNVDVVDMRFGSFQHICHLKHDGSFIVEQKYGLRSGQDCYKVDQKKTVGHISKNDQRGCQRVPGQKAPKSISSGKRSKQFDDENSELSVSTSFSQKDLQFGAFFAAWSEWRAKKARCLMEAAVCEGTIVEVSPVSEPYS